MSGKGSWQRPGQGYEENHEAIFGKRERRQYVPPPMPRERGAEGGALSLAKPAGTRMDAGFDPGHLDAEGLPPLPEPRAIRAGHSFPKVYALAYTADQVRQAQRDAIAAYSAHATTQKEKV